MKKAIVISLSLLIALTVAGCSTKSIVENEEPTTSSNLEASILSMQAEIDALNEKLEQTSSTTTTQYTTTTAKPTPGVIIDMPISTRTTTTTTTTTTEPLPVVPNVIGMTVEDALIAISEAGIGGFTSGGYPYDYIVTSVSPSVGTQILRSRVVDITAAEPPQQ